MPRGCGVVLDPAQDAGIIRRQVFDVVRAPVQAMAVYFLHVQHLPLDRAAVLFIELYGIRVSEGF